VRAFFYDTWGLVALANRADPHHAVSSEAGHALRDAGLCAVMSDYVFGEALTLLHVSAGAREALTLADVLLSRVEGGELLLVEITAPRRAEALRLFRRLAPETPRLSFTDCTSFALMRELGIQVAFTADQHFHRAGRGIRPLFGRTGAGLELRLPR
jgi:predicted nucleic acid-binding protein